ncbi:MAG: hypothetical protein ACP5RZ_02580 [Thermoplasmata archaeon]
MKYTIPDEKLIEKIIEKIFIENPEINSQKKLIDLIRKELALKDKNLRISVRRLRKIAINDAKVKINIQYKELNKNSDILKKCPVCGNDLKAIYNYTLDGEKVYVGKKCEVCLYWTGIKLRLPKRYTFYR